LKNIDIFIWDEEHQWRHDICFKDYGSYIALHNK